MSDTLEFVGVTLLFICLTAFSFVAGASPSLGLERAQLVTLFIDAGMGTLIGIALTIVALRRQGIALRGALAVVMACMMIVLAVVYVPTWLILTYLPVLRLPGGP